LHAKPASVGVFSDICGAQGRDKIHALYVLSLLAILVVMMVTITSTAFAQPLDM
jgi:hypothetical protein